MSSRVYLKISAIVQLTGFSRQKVQRDCLRFRWPYTTCFNSPIRLYSADAIEKSYGNKFQPEIVSMIARKLNKIAVYVKECQNEYGN